MTLGLASPVVRPVRVGDVLSESLLFRGYARGSTLEACVGGGRIEALTLASDDIARAVGAHNATGRHLAWRAEYSIDLEPAS